MMMNSEMLNMTRRFSDLAGLGDDGYFTLLALAVFAWHSEHGRGRDAKRVLYKVLAGSSFYKARVAGSAIDRLNSLDYLSFECQSPIWKPRGWRACPRDWRLTVKGRERLGELLQNLGLTIEDVLKQPSPPDVKTLIDGRIRAIYREHWEKVRKYEEVAGHGFQ
jgi:hypothetical protein